MKVKPVKIVTRVGILSLITISIIYGANLSKNDTTLESTYNNMSTTQLQVQVERLSQNGELPFPMGLELIKRWTHK